MSSTRLERARQRVLDSAEGIAEQKFRITGLRADGADSAESVRFLDALRTTHRLLLDQLAIEETKPQE